MDQLQTRAQDTSLLPLPPQGRVPISLRCPLLLLGSDVVGRGSVPAVLIGRQEPTAKTTLQHTPSSTPRGQRHPAHPKRHRTSEGAGLQMGTSKEGDTWPLTHKPQKERAKRKQTFPKIRDCALSCPYFYATLSIFGQFYK